MNGAEGPLPQAEDCWQSHEGARASANTYQAPRVKSAHSSYDVDFRRHIWLFRSGSVVGL